MPRALILFVLGVLALAGAPAQGIDAPVPLWTPGPPGLLVEPGKPFEAEVLVRLPEGYYQDAASPFLTFEPRPPFQVTARSSSPPDRRGGKESFTGTFTLRRTLVLPAGTAPGPLTLTFTTGWQICRENGVCLLPGEGTVSLPLTVAPLTGPSPGASDGLSFWAALAAAFAGGLLLNFMPCVFPVLALKALGLASAASGTLARRRREALAFAAGGFGVIFGLGLVTAGLAAAGQRLDWGFTFQQPAFVWALTLAFWLFTLQLWGVWTWIRPPFSLAAPARGLPAWAGGAFLVLAAAPCTAPLLGPALGYALGQPPAAVPLFFGAAGLGLVTPLMVLHWFPGWTRRLPPPGRWMVTAERTAGFFLAATVLYLVWVLTRQTDADRVWAALGALGLAAGAGAWMDRVRGKARAAVGILAAAVLAASFGVAAVPPAPSGSPEAPRLDGGWRPFSQEALDRALLSGQPVLVDATAAWCATCQVNELTVLNRPDVAARMDSLGIVRLRADYTRPDPAVGRWLAGVGRAGLPVYALYVPGKPVYLFPELLTDGNFTEVLPGLVGNPPGP